MHKSKALTTMLILAAIILSLWSCQTPAGRTTGQVVDDATITTKVKSKMLYDSILKGFAVSVVTFQGEVTLTGAVDNQNNRKRAEELARSTTGVRKVNNLIGIK